MRCPGQDMRYWKGDAAFEVGCPKCGAAVEFFKDENSRRCRRCSHSFPNPKIGFDCARWCEYSETCLGANAQNGSRAVSPEAAFASRLLTTSEDLFARIEAPGSPAFLVFQHARELVSKAPCNPRLVLAAALVIELELHSRGASAGGRLAKPGRSAKQPSAEQLLGRFGMADIDIHGVYRVLQRFRGEPSPTDIETKIVCDAAALAELATGNFRGDLDKVKPRILGELKTRAGKERAKNLFGC